MAASDPLLPRPKHVPEITCDDAKTASDRVVATSDHELIRRWAGKRRAEPATGEETATGPATLNVKDGGAGIRFNFPGASKFRPITWDEWFENFDLHGLMFVYDNDGQDQKPSNRYQMIKRQDWTGAIG